MKRGGRKSSKTQTARLATTTPRRPKKPSAEVLARREAARKRRELKRWGRQAETFLRDLVVYFLVFSYFGHLLEAVVTIISGVHSTAILRNPFEPYTIYGTAVVILIILTDGVLEVVERKWALKWKAWQKLLARFLFCTLVCAIVEYSASAYMTRFWGANPYWNYSSVPFNLNGHICLMNTLGFGVIATVFTIVFPRLDKLVRKVPSKVMNTILLILIIMFGLYYFGPLKNI